jgi:hypothetical protein
LVERGSRGSNLSLFPPYLTHLSLLPLFFLSSSSLSHELLLLPELLLGAWRPDELLPELLLGAPTSSSPAPRRAPPRQDDVLLPSQLLSDELLPDELFSGQLLFDELLPNVLLPDVLLSRSPPLTSSNDLLPDGRRRFSTAAAAVPFFLNYIVLTRSA